MSAATEILKEIASGKHIGNEKQVAIDYLLKPAKRFVPPTLSEVWDYCKKRENNIDAEAFINHYKTNGWVQGKGRKPIKSWKACIITWEKSSKPNINKQLKDTSWAENLDDVL